MVISSNNELTVNNILKLGEHGPLSYGQRVVLECAVLSYLRKSQEPSIVASLFQARFSQLS